MFRPCIRSLSCAHNGSTRPDWIQARTAMWRAFYRCCASKAARNLPPPGKRSFLTRAATPALNFPITWRAPTPQFIAEVDRAQSRITAIMLSLRKGAEETPEGFVRKRARLAGQGAGESLWSALCVKRVAAWDAHLRRDRNRDNWPARLLEWKGEAWLQQRQVAPNYSSDFAGRTGTRASAAQASQRRCALAGWRLSGDHSPKITSNENDRRRS